MPTKEKVKIEIDYSKADLDLIKGELSRRSLKEFIKCFWKVLEPTQPFVDGWIIDAYCEHLANIKQIKSLLVNVPPGTSKSLVFACFFFCWTWLHDPSSRFLYSSYGLNLSERDSLKCRRLIAHPLYQKCYKDVFHITASEDTKKLFSNNKTGYRQSISIGSTTTGLKCNYAICDDPHNAIDADSAIKKQETILWYQDGFHNRLNDFEKDCRIVIGQRIAKDDLSNFILENYKQTYHHLCIPYQYTKSNYVTTWGWKDPRVEEGESCWPERFPESFIADERRKQKKFSAQYNQNPIDLANALFKPDSFRYYDETPDGYRLATRTVKRGVDTWRFITVDLAISEKVRADWTVIAVGSITNRGDIIIDHIFRDKMSGTKIVPKLLEINKIYNPAYILVEDVGFQRSVIDQARAEGLAIRGFRPQGLGDKESRSLPLQTRFEAGQVWFPKNASWLAYVEKELIEFPNSHWDDVTDCLSMMAIEVSKRCRTKPVDNVAPQQKTQEELYREQLFSGLR